MIQGHYLQLLWIFCYLLIFFPYFIDTSSWSGTYLEWKREISIFQSETKYLLQILQEIGSPSAALKKREHIRLYD